MRAVLEAVEPALLPSRIQMAFTLATHVLLVPFVGALSVLAANAWMNTPAGATISNGRVTDVDVIAALFPKAGGYEFWHFSIALYITAGFVVASIYAAAWLRGRRD